MSQAIQTPQPVKPVQPAASIESEGTSGSRRHLLYRVLVRQETTLLLVILAIGTFAAARNSVFLQTGNLTAIGSATVIYFVMGCGASLLMVGGGLDFSVGSVFTLGGVTSAWLLIHSVPLPVAVLLGVAVGAAFGCLNYVIIVHMHVPPIIATLGTFFIISGGIVQITGGLDITPLPNRFDNLGQNQIWGIPYPIWYAVAAGLLFWFLLEKTRFGVNVRALGGNRQAAIGNGLRARRLDLALYALAGATAGFAGVIFTAQVGSGQIEAGGAATTLYVITAVLIGGISLGGGLGTITGMAAGAVLLSVINNALQVAHIPPQYNNIIVGTILILAVAFDHLRRSRLYRR